MNRPEEEPKTRHLSAKDEPSQDVEFSADDMTIDHAPSQTDGLPDETIVTTGISDRIARLGRDTKLPQIPGYEVLDILGRGGMGVVYKARDLKLKRLVAIKMILAGEHAGESELARFRAEAETVARLQHPNFVQIYEVGEHNNHQFLVLELVTGGSLADYLDKTTLSTRQAAELAEALARAIHYAHERGVIHRDLKPGNILLAISETGSDADRTKEQSVGSTWNSGASSVSRYGTTSGLVPKITDFGLAKQLDANSEHTKTGAVIGTPNYMAPEQAAGQARTSGPAVDTYAMGAILYVLLTGRPPFHAETQVETLVLVRDSEPVPPTRLHKRLPRDLETICLKCLEKQPAKRYASSADLADDLRRYLSGAPIQARPVGFVERTWKWIRRYPSVAAFICVCMITMPLLALKWREAATNLAVAEQAKLDAVGSEREAQRERNIAVEANLALQKQSSRLLFDRGLAKCNEGKFAEGLHWLAESLHVSPNESHDAHWRQVIRYNLAAWRERLEPLRYRLRFAEEVTSIAFSENHNRLLVGFMEGAIRRVDLKTGKLLADGDSLQVPKSGWSATWGIACPPDEDWFLAGGGERGQGGAPIGRIGKFDIKSGKQIGDSVNLPMSVDAVALHPNKKLYSAGYGDLRENLGFVRVAATNDHKPAFKDAPVPGYVSLLMFSTDGSYLYARVIGSKSGKQFLVLDAKTGKRLDTKTFNFSENLFRSNYGLVQIDPNTGRASSIPPTGNYIDGQAFSFSLKDARRKHAVDFVGRVLSIHGTSQSQTSSYYQADKELIRKAPSAGKAEYPYIAVSKQRDQLVIGKRNETARVVRVSDGQVVSLPQGQSPLTMAVAIHPNGKLFAVGGDRARIWDVQTGKPVTPWLAHTNSIGALAFSPDGKTLAVGDYAFEVKLWNVETGELLGEPLKQRDIVVSLAFSPDGTKLAAGTASDWNHDPQARIWNVATMQPIGPALRHKHYVRRLEFSRDNSKLLTISSDGTVQVWDANSGNPIGSRIPYAKVYGRACLSPDGKHVLTGNEKGDVRLWYADSGKPVADAVAAGSSHVVSLGFSGDGSRFAVGYRNGTSQLFDAQLFVPLGPKVVQPLPVRHISVSESGDSWITLTRNGMPRTWQTVKPIGRAPNEIKHLLQLETAMTIQGNTIVQLLPAQWEELDSNSRLGNLDPSEKSNRRRTWLTSRANDAEQFHRPRHAG